jgi:hypothetical protein
MFCDIVSYVIHKEWIYPYWLLLGAMIGAERGRSSLDKRYIVEAGLSSFI